MLRTGSTLPQFLRFAGAPACLGLAATAFAAPPQDGELFFRAYYLEHEVGDLDSALELYRSAANDSGLSAEARARAERHARACAEEIAAGDLARLVPEDTIFYLELNEPGGQVARLLDQLGLLQGDDGADRIGISPHLLEGTLGLKGAAVAVTRVDPTGGIPGGVVILHPGDVRAVRGLIETALPAGGEPVDDIAGNPTFRVENMAYVTTTDRLVLASTERELIADVLSRVGSDGDGSLAGHPDLADTMSMRGQDLAFFCLNAEPIMPLAQTMLGAMAAQDPQAAMALGMLDVQSLQSIAGRLGVQDEGISMDVSLQLAEGHRNVLFDLMRMPHVREHTFHLVPEGAAFFAATSLNSGVEGSAGVSDANGKPVVTMMDIGREIFGNIRDVAVFSMPSMTDGPFGTPMPDAAIALSVNDIERSKAIWELVLGVAKGASGSGDTRGRGEKIDGITVDRYDVQGVPIYLFAQDDRLVLSPSVRAIEAAVGAKAGRNIASDPAYADLVAQGSSDHTSVFAVAIGRCAEMARPMIPAHELAEVGPILELLKDAHLSARTKHSDTELRWSAALVGLPNVQPLVEQFVLSQRGGGNAYENRPRRDRVAALSAAPKTDEAKDTGIATLRGTFDRLRSSGRHAEAAELLPAIGKLVKDDAIALNAVAWSAISGEGSDHYASAVLPLAERANKLTGYEDWRLLDTLAHVRFALGNRDEAVEIQLKAVALAEKTDSDRAKEAMASLTRFRAQN
ncbi:MAG: hypothetical protein AAGA20_01040 [Planctomycetota bacterium]